MKHKRLDQVSNQWWWRQPNPVWVFGQKGKNPYRTANNPVSSELLQGHAYRGLYIWKDGCEWAAFSWELLRRCKSAPKNLPPFIELTHDHICALIRLFGKSELVWIYEAGGSQREDQSAPVYWNLSLGDGSLVAGFRQFITEQRQLRGIKRPRKGRSSETSQGPSWRAVEVIDLGRQSLRKGTHFDPKIFRDATKSAAQFWLKFTQAKPPEMANLL